MAKKVGDLNESEIKKIRQESIGLLNDIDSIGKSINSNLQKVSQLTGESVAGFKESFNAAKALGDAISKVDSETLKSKKQQSAFQDKVRKAQEEATKLEAKAARLRAEAVNFTKEQAKQAFRVARAYEDGAEKLKEQAKAAGRITDEFEKLNNQTKFFDGMADLVKDIPVVSNVLKDFQKASDKAREAASEGGNAFKAGAKELGNLGLKGLGALGIGLAIKGIKDIDVKTTSLARNLNISRDQATIIAKEFNSTARSINGITGSDLVNASQDFAKSIGTTAILSKDSAEEFATQTKYLGLSADEASKLVKFTEATGKNAKTLGNEIRGEVKASNVLNKTAIDYKAITKDIANVSAAVKLSTEGTGKSLAKAAIESKKLGLSLSQVDKIASSLLDFESSISAELEAELLTGEQLNLEEARRLALNNDIAGVANEISKQGITAEKFSKMNRIQQESIAKSLGMQREDMAEMFLEQKALSNLGAKDKTQLNEKVKAQLKSIENIKDETAREKARAELIAKLGSDELVKQQENRNLQELQADAAQKTVEAFDKLSPILDTIGGVFKAIENNVQIIATVLGAMGGLLIFKQISKMGKVFDKMSGMGSIFGLGGKGGGKVAQAVMTETGKTVSGAAAQAAVKAGTATATKAVPKTLGKSLLKKIPIIGALAGIGFGLSRLAEGDLLGAAGEVASGLVGTIPGAGTAASIGIDTALAVRDVKKASNVQTNEPEMATGGIVTRRTKAVVGEAGPEAVIPLDKFYAKLDELISTVKQGGNIYLDGTKVGTAMAVGTYKVQ